MKMCIVGTKLFHVDGEMYRQTDKHDKANSHPLQFANVPKNFSQNNNKCEHTTVKEHIQFFQQAGTQLCQRLFPAH